MATASTSTLLSLDRYAEILGLDPRWFNQVRFAAQDDGSLSCDPYWFQHGWQNPEQVSREELARAIAEAEAVLTQYLGYPPAPDWDVVECDMPSLRRAYSPGTAVRPGLLAAETAPSVHTRYARVLAGGRKCWTLLAENVPVTYSDPYGLGFPDLATVEFDTAITLSTRELALVPAGTPTALLEQRRIRNLRNIAITGMQVHAEGLSCTFVEPDLWEKPEVIDGDDPTSFLEAVDAYRRANSSDGEDYAAVEFQGRAQDGCAPEVQVGCLFLRRAYEGLVAPAPATWDGSAWSSAPLTLVPEVIRIHYYAGYPSDARGEMAPPLDRAVAALATAMLDKPLCGCGHAGNLADFWRKVPGEGETLPLRQAECPFGPQNGAYHAYLLASQLLSVGASAL